MNYNGVPIASPDTRPDLAKPVIYWVPVIAPGNIMFYKGSVFPQWNGNALISGLVTMALVRVTFDGKGGATAAQRWSIGKRIRDVEEAPDGSLWMVEDASPGGALPSHAEIVRPERSRENTGEASDEIPSRWAVLFFA